MRKKRLNLLKPCAGQGMVEYLAGVIVVFFLITSLWLLIIPDTLTNLYNDVFEGVQDDFANT